MEEEEEEVVVVGGVAINFDDMTLCVFVYETAREFPVSR